MASFQDELHRLRRAYEDPAFLSEIDNLIALDPDIETFWLRETGDLVNIVGLGAGVIYDLSWQPHRTITQTIILKTSAIVSIETRASEDAAITLGLGVTGPIAVVVHVAADRGGVVWVADDESLPGLQEFIRSVARIAFA
jgi:hypothetical protein